MSQVGVVVVDHGSKVQESNQLFETFIRRFRDEFQYKIVEPAHMELAEPNLKEAFKRCVDQGADRITVVPYFFFPGRHVRFDIPRLCNEASQEYGDIPFKVAEPLGLHTLMKNIIADRIELIDE